MTTAATNAIADRLALIDLVNGYFDAVDTKRWEALEDFYTEDAVAWWNPEKSTTGRAGVVNYTRSMLQGDEIVTYHHVASFTPVIDGDTAHAAIRVRAMHNGVGERAGRFWESLAIQDTDFVRTPDGWRCREFKWRVVVGLGSLDLFEGLWPEMRA